MRAISNQMNIDEKMCYHKRIGKRAQKFFECSTADILTHLELGDNQHVDFPNINWINKAKCIQLENILPE